MFFVFICQRTNRSSIFILKNDDFHNNINQYGCYSPIEFTKEFILHYEAIRLQQTGFHDDGYLLPILGLTTGSNKYTLRKEIQVYSYLSRRYTLIYVLGSFTIHHLKESAYLLVVQMVYTLGRRIHLQKRQSIYSCRRAICYPLNQKSIKDTLKSLFIFF